MYTICVWFALVYETGFLCTALAVLEVTLWTRLASIELRDLACLCLPGAGFKDVCHHTQQEIASEAQVRIQ